MEDNFSTEVGVGWGAGEHGSGGNVSDGEQWGAADEASLTRTPPHLLLCGPGFLTGLGVGDPCSRSVPQYVCLTQCLIIILTLVILLMIV